MQLKNWIILLQILAVTCTLKAAGFNDTVSCEDKANLSLAELQQEANRNGQCVFYTAGSSDSHSNPCNQFYRTNIDRVYLPRGRALDSIERLNEFAADANLIGDLLQPPCRDPGLRAVCYHYYPPCGNATHFELPSALCQDTCFYVTEDICRREFQLALQQFSGISDFINLLNLQFVNCSKPGSALGFLPHCCSDAGIRIDNSTRSTNPTSSNPAISNPTSSSTVITAASVAAASAVVLVVAIGTVLFCCVAKKPCMKQPDIVLQFNTPSEMVPSESPGQYVNTLALPTTSSAEHNTYAESAWNHHRQIVKVPSKYIRNMSESNLLIPASHIQLCETVGQGEFGVVYRGFVTSWQGKTTKLVAVKTLRDLFSRNDVDDLMKESEKMKRFDHPNVLSLIGVCIDVGEAPYIVMPFMSNGSLLAYLRKERPNLTIAEEAGQEIIDEAQRKLLSMCHQIAKGMSYLAKQKFVHRDLAARNCMIDETFTLKVADFGLTEDIYCTNYFRQGQGSDGEERSKVKLPIKWMALECLLDGIFSEKTDVWSYGVTCWEIFSLGHTPYPGIAPFALIKFLKGGERLEKPTNAACTTEVYNMITECMNELPQNRPSFDSLVLKINSFLEGVAGYLDFSAFSPIHQSGYDHLETKGDHIDEEQYSQPMVTLNSRDWVAIPGGG